MPADAAQCLSTAVSANGKAELAWTLPTTEGDPIVYFAFVEEGNPEVIVFITNAFGSYGGDPRWTTSSCTDAIVAISLIGCVAS